MSDRTIATDALATLGTLIDETQKRDAIHLAVIPVKAGCNLRPAQDVFIDLDGLASAFYGGQGEPEPLGIVDPFVRLNYPETIRPGQWFWLVIYPRKITSLRHVWSHPAFVDEGVIETVPLAAKEFSRQWLEDFAERLFSYAPDGMTRLDVLLAGAEKGGFSQDIEYGPGLAPNSEFWFHYEQYTGRKVMKANRRDYFRCSC
jgi:hypothetical protein